MQRLAPSETLTNMVSDGDTQIDVEDASYEQFF